MTGPDEWVLVRNCTTLHEAVFLRSVLEGSEIECFLSDEHMASIRPELSMLLGGVRILVRASDFTRAKEALTLADGADGPSEKNE
jgi:hypothetical protein